MRKVITGLLIALSNNFLLSADEPCPAIQREEVNCQPCRAYCPPNRVYALRRYETEGEVNYNDTSWASKLEDSFYDSLTR